MREKSKKTVFENGQKIGFLEGVFPSLDTLVITSIFVFASIAYCISFVAFFVDKWTGIKKARIV